MSKKVVSFLLVFLFLFSSLNIPVFGDETDPSLILWYNFDDESSDVITDLSGHENHGIPFGNLTISDGLFDKSAKFNGINTYIKLPSNLMADITDFTISTWVYLESSSMWQRVFDFGVNSSKYMFFAPNGDDVGRFAITVSGNGSEQRVSGSQVPINSWQHIVITKSGNTVTYYLNGSYNSSSNSVTLNPRDLGENLNNYIGKSQFTADDPYLKGYVDEFKVYNRALSVEEIAEEYSKKDIAQAKKDVADTIKSINLGDTNYVIGNLTLPNAGVNNTVITWTSSDEEFLANDGTLVKRPGAGEGSKEIILTARVSKYNQFDVLLYEETKEFIIVIPEQNILKDELYQLDFGKTKVIYEDLALPEKTPSGLDITWTSLNPDYLTDEGKVIRPKDEEGRQEVVIRATVTDGTDTEYKDFTFTVLPEFKAYIMAYHKTGDTYFTNAMHLAYSLDGLNWIPLNNDQPILYSKTSTDGDRNKRFVDPYIYRKEDGTFGVVSVDYPSNYSRNIIVWDSLDLVNYTNEQNITFDNSYIFSPKVIYDKESAKYIYYWSNAKINMRKTDDLKNFAATEQLYSTNKNIMDSQIIYDGGKYYLVFGDQTSRTINMAVSSSLSEAFTPYENAILQNANKAFVTKSIDDDKWYLYYYNQSQNKWAVANVSDLENLDLQYEENYQLPSNIKSLSILPITQSELDTVIASLAGNVEIKSMEFENITVNTTVGVKPSLPETVRVYYNNNTDEELDIIWDELTPQQLSTPGTYEIQGKLNIPSYSNPLILNRADPHIYKHTDGYYYFTASYMNPQDPPYYNAIILRRAKTIEGLKDPETEKIIWRKNPSGQLSNFIWAPEIHYLDGKWYIYFAASRNSLWEIRPYYIECASEDPFEGPWSYPQPMNVNLDTFSLDGTVFEANGERYFVWAEKPSGVSYLIIAKMLSPTQLDSKQVIISMPDYSWELQNEKVEEAPAVLKKDGKIYLAFSASATGAVYCLGLLYADEDADLLNPASWTKVPYPVMFTNEKTSEYGPGHNSFTVAEDGKTDLVVYHSRSYRDIAGDPLYNPDRHTRVQKLYYNADGKPNFGIPGGAISDVYVTATVVVSENTDPYINYHVEVGTEFEAEAKIITSNIEVTNHTAVDEPSIALMALYDTEGKLVEVKSGFINAKVGETENLSLSMRLARDTKGQVKVFIWLADSEGKNTLIPATMPVVYDIID